MLPLLCDTNLFENVSPSKGHWLSSGAGIWGIGYTLIITKSHVGIEFSISTSNKDKNKAYFKKLIKNKEEIENAFGNSLDWDELPDNKMSRIKFELQDVNLFNNNHWEKMNLFFIENLPKLEKAFSPFIKNLK